jgi:ketosteroid isomerase-like protein
MEETLMTTAELAKAFTDLLKQGDHEGAAAKYNADNIASYEAMEGPMAVCKGKDAVKQKNDWWFANHEVHGGSVEGPYVNGDQFALRFTMDITRKETGERVKMDEVGLYTVKDDKIVEERFYY